MWVFASPSQSARHDFGDLSHYFTLGTFAWQMAEQRQILARLETRLRPQRRLTPRGVDLLALEHETHDEYQRKS